MSKLIFLDFDGVLRRETSNTTRFDADCLQHFESVMRQTDKSRIVISSTWRLTVSLNKMRSMFSSDIADRILGVTPENLDDGQYARHEEIHAFLREQKMTALPWLAVDDVASHFPPGSPLLLTDPLKGFDAECTVQLLQMIRN